MRILLRWLVDNSWVFYVLCAIGVLIYIVRALGAARERRLAVFTLERETATSRIVQALTVMLIFAALGGLIYVSTTRVLPQLPMFNPEIPEATATPAAGLEPTPSAELSATPALAATAEALLLTLTPATGLTEEVVVSPPPEVATSETPTLEAIPTLTQTPGGAAPTALSGQMNTRFGEAVALVAYSLPSSEVSVQQAVSLALTWQAISGPTPSNYSVFTHLIAQDGHLIAQHDGAPAGGSRPTTAWAAGESIADLHPMSFSDLNYTGPATIRVGMYDPSSGSRILTDTGADFVVLPVTLNVVP